MKSFLFVSFNIFCLFVVHSQVLPRDFAWGTATAAFQVEGAWNVSGRGESIWDYFQNIPGRIYDDETAHVADDFYHRYPDDIKLIQQIGANNFRLSISWTRVLPTGGVDNISQEGVQFYLDLLTALKSAGIEPYVTLFHWDLPQTYNNFQSNGTWLDPDIPNKFNQFADFCFKTFGHLVKKWLTFNEIQTFTWVAYGIGVHAPGRCSPDINSFCASVGGGGDSGTEPYLAAHNALISHALAVQTYRTKYQKSQGGQIGMTISSAYFEPWNVSNPNDVQAVNTGVAFQYGWFADPMVFGDYPSEMKNLITGNRLPVFNNSIKALLKGSYDFLGVNYYTSYYAKYTGAVGTNFGNDGRFDQTPYNASGKLIGPFAESGWLNVYAPGFRGLLNWINKRYNKPTIYVFENGVSCPGENDEPETTALNDEFRIDYIYNHVMNMLDAIVEDGVNVRGYFLWSLLDNFEWSDGYHVRFGITYVDYENGLTRTLKQSAYLYQSLIQYLGVHGYQKHLMPNADYLIRWRAAQTS